MVNVNNKETILQATLQIASQKGLGNISLSQIAKEVGIQKASLYSHFSSKEELINSLYVYLRDNASKALRKEIDYGELVCKQSAYETLYQAVMEYKKIVLDPNMNQFYRFIMSERVFHKEAASIMVQESERMIQATKQILYAMQVHQVLDFLDVDMAAISFAMSVHSLLDYTLDKEFIEEEMQPLLERYIRYFCQLHAKEKRS